MIKNNILKIGPDCHLTIDDIYLVSHNHEIKIELTEEAIKKNKRK